MKVQNNICEGSLITNYLPADYCDSLFHLFGNSVQNGTHDRFMERTNKEEVESSILRE